MDVLTINLDNLLIQLQAQLSSKWYQFGLSIGIQKETLNTFAEKCTPEDCIVEMLDFWLRHHKGQPTWKEIAEALKAIDLLQLAEDIESVYTTVTGIITFMHKIIPRVYSLSAGEAHFTKSCLLI